MIDHVLHKSRGYKDLLKYSVDACTSGTGEECADRSSVSLSTLRATIDTART